MEISIEELLNKGLPVQNKNKNYFSAEQYVTPFLDRMQKYTDDFRVQVKLPDTISLTKDNSLPNLGFTRVYVQAVLPDDYGFANHKEVIGMVYGIDVRKPVVKFYKGGLNCACTNLCVFSPQELAVQELEDNTAINYKPLTEIIEKSDNVVKYLTELSNTEFKATPQNLNESLGRWIRNCMHMGYNSGFGEVKLANSVPIDAYKLMFEKEDSPYYVGIDNSTTMFNIYNSFTELLTQGLKKDVISHFEKTLLVKSILGF